MCIPLTSATDAAGGAGAVAAAVSAAALRAAAEAPAVAAAAAAASVSEENSFWILGMLTGFCTLLLHVGVRSS